MKKLIFVAFVVMVFINAKAGVEPRFLDRKTWILSIGISNYSASGELANKISFTNAARDADSVAQSIKKQFYKVNSHLDSNLYDTLINSFVLINSMATYDAIVQSINNIISKSDIDDTFIFFFSGFSNLIKDSSGEEQVYFCPYGLYNILDTNEVIKNALSINTIKNLFQFLRPQNQMYIIEAGPTPNYARDFMKLVIEDNMDIAEMNPMNRVFIGPKEYGLDDFYLNGERVVMGPLAYAIGNMQEQNFSLFDFFEDNKKMITESFLSSNTFKASGKDYLGFYYERELVNDLRYFFKTNSQSTRGVNPANDEYEQKSGLSNSKRYALVIGTDYYLEGGQWKKLSNPVYDAKAIAKELKETYGYSVELLLNASQDSIVKALMRYPKKLDSLDQFILFVAGHGDFDKLLDDGMIVCRDSKNYTDDPFKKTYIQFSKISRMLNKLPAKQVMVILDVCFGGAFDEQVARNEARGDDSYDELAKDDYFKIKMKLSTRIYLTSGGKTSVPDGWAQKHSPFAAKLLTLLRKEGGTTGYITSGGMYDLVKRLPSGPLLGSFGDDEPGSEFILVPEKR